MSNAHFAHGVGMLFKSSDKLTPVGKGKSPVAGFAAGFLFGPVGVGIYLKSFTDFGLSLGMVIIGSMLTVGLGAPFFWALCGAWAAVRVHNSNKT